MLAKSKKFVGLRVGDKIAVRSDASCRQVAFEIKELDVEPTTENRWVADSKGDKFFENHGYTVMLESRK